MIESYLRKLYTFHTKKTLQKIVGIFWPNAISYQHILKQSNQDNIATIITKRQWKWIWHVIQREQNNIPQNALQWTTDERLAERLTVEEELKILNNTWGTIKTLAQNRQGWRSFVADLHAPRHKGAVSKYTFRQNKRYANPNNRKWLFKCKCDSQPEAKPWFFETYSYHSGTIIGVCICLLQKSGLYKWKCRPASNGGMLRHAPLIALILVRLQGLDTKRWQKHYYLNVCIVYLSNGLLLGTKSKWLPEYPEKEQHLC